MFQTKTKSFKKIIIAILLVLVGVFGYIVWYKAFRVVPQPAFASDEKQYMYGSLGAEDNAGLPYWIFLVLPRMFPEHLPGPGGYSSLGILWEQGEEMPVGFSKKTVGFPRVTNNCAVCHTGSYREKTDSNPVYVTTAPGHTANVQGYFRFLSDVARDPRFNPDNIIAEMEQVTELDFIDKLMYRFFIIPILKDRLIEQGDNFAWMNHENLPDWLQGRDDPMNLTKYFMLELPEDGTFAPTDFPSIWNMKKYKEGMALNWDGATPVLLSVIIDSALGTGAEPGNEFMEKMIWLETYLKERPAPKYPFEIETALADTGQMVFESNCATCHNSDKTGKSINIDEIGTDRNRLESWNKDAAIAANKKVKSMGVNRTPMVEETLTGYIAVHLDGIWLRAPYLHNGSVPTLRDLLKPVDQRPAVFYRGYDVYDKENVGFVSQGPEAERTGTKHDTSLKANSNMGHDYGTNLNEDEKNALLEYLKTL